MTQNLPNSQNFSREQTCKHVRNSNWVGIHFDDLEDIRFARHWIFTFL